MTSENPRLTIYSQIRNKHGMNFEVKFEKQMDWNTHTIYKESSAQKIYNLKGKNQKERLNFMETRILKRKLY